jgi:hypothetical protein
MVTGYINMYEQQVELDMQELRELKEVLREMESPFGFIQGFQMDVQVHQKAEKRVEEFEEHKQEKLMDWEITPQMQARLDIMNEKEKDIELKVDEVS